ncbi:HypC/HybG/HupF family hydrogenase formation chaperone [Kyrpidia tusciae]|uniref:Hydrogenase assembly chaperone hypC/hupF n=1 Tax=Kyrpidia tusciae (strain DSM 2912 / NBRC 15312 / T2) TaxID=562970 RepID=D5WTE1_KYRT2|nr:HypC/HybG/HupF family hydrogenase formation chaperone [Kyrpidia tusciae]ADG07177.1 hydrogenase assembly chaperone hypC/hupF [Kyrpidia tusciae DSM 2912]
MCLAIPGRIVELLDEEQQYAVVDVSGVRRTINIGLLRHEGMQLGEWVLIHVGFAMSKISEEQAEEQIRLLTMLGEAAQAEEEVRGYRFEEIAPGGLASGEDIPDAEERNVRS